MAASSVVLGALLAGCSSSSDAFSPTLPASVSSDAASPGSPSAEDPTAGVDPGLARFYDQQVDWKNCGLSECGTVTVPLDYSDPDGPTIDLAIARTPATGESIGSLFVDPGGPGGSAVDYAKAADAIVTPAVRESYDVVGLDPRGVGASAPVDCLTDEETDRLLALDGTPDSAAEEQQVEQQALAVGASCAADAAPVYAHVGTPDAARDLDIARAVVGDDVLSYLGKSYGSQLGAVYAELFPQRVGRMVLDGILPASLDLVQVTKEQAEAFEVALRDFAADCLGRSDCPLTGDVDEAVSQVQDWFAAVESAPLSSGGRELTEPLAMYAVLANLYFPSYDYPRLRAALAAAMGEDDAGPMLAILDDRISRGPDGRYLDNSTDAFYAVTCLDRPFAGTVDDVKELAQQWQATAPTFGESLAWGLLTCKDWPATEDGPVTSTVADGSNPILLVSTRQDPATPYQWGEVVAGQLANARLLTYDGTGHTAYTQGSECIDDAVDAYLLRGELPAEGARCS